MDRPNPKVELRVDTDSVSVPIERYDELISKKTTLEIVTMAYHNSASYEFDRMLKIFFGTKKGDTDAE